MLTVITQKRREKRFKTFLLCRILVRKKYKTKNNNYLVEIRRLSLAKGLRMDGVAFIATIFLNKYRCQIFSFYYFISL